MASLLASPPRDACCNLTDFEYRGTPQGSVITVADLQTYVSRPNCNTTSIGDRIVLFFPDIRGPFYVNNKLVADYFASNGFLVFAPDYFEGNPIQVADQQSDFNREIWVSVSETRSKMSTPKWIDAIIKEFGNGKTKYCTVGYCFGAPFVLDVCATDLVKAGAIAHPLFLDEAHFRSLKKPLFLSCSETDDTFPAESRHASEKILAEIKAKYHFQLFSGVAHGFALRENIEDGNERWAKEQSAKGIVGWWNRFLGID